MSQSLRSDARCRGAGCGVVSPACLSDARLQGWCLPLVSQSLRSDAVTPAPGSCLPLVSLCLPASAVGCLFNAYSPQQGPGQNQLKLLLGHRDVSHAGRRCNFHTPPWFAALRISGTLGHRSGPALYLNWKLYAHCHTCGFSRPEVALLVLIWLGMKSLHIPQHLSRCACHLGVLIIWLACVQCCAGALERVCLSFGWRVCSAARVHLSGCAYHLAGVCAVLCGCT